MLTLSSTGTGIKVLRSSKSNVRGPEPPIYPHEGKDQLQLQSKLTSFRKLFNIYSLEAFIVMSDNILGRNNNIFV